MEEFLLFRNTRKALINVDYYMTDYSSMIVMGPGAIDVAASDNY